MNNPFARHLAKHRNEIDQSCAELVGIAEGVLGDQSLNDSEINFLNAWLNRHQAIAREWPGDIIQARVKNALADGVITEEERTDLVETLIKLIGGRLDDLANAPRVTELAFDDTDDIDFEGTNFCVTGEFVLGPRERCIDEIRNRGGVIRGTVSGTTDYLIVGGMGSDEWKHGSFGTKIQKAIEYRAAGKPILIIHEDRWAAALFNK
jgi:NAD-dependent DNA ligase